MCIRDRIITVDGTPYTATIIDGKATGTIKDLTAGDYTAVSYTHLFNCIWFYF